MLPFHLNEPLHSPPIRVLVAKAGLDGHDRDAKIAALRQPVTGLSLLRIEVAGSHVEELLLILRKIVQSVAGKEPRRAPNVDEPSPTSISDSAGSTRNTLNRIECMKSDIKWPKSTAYHIKSSMYLFYFVCLTGKNQDTPPLRLLCNRN